MELNGVAATVEQVKALALTNYGHFTSMLVEDGGVRGLSLHLRRLACDSRELFGADLDTERVRQHVRHALAGVARPVTARVTVYDPALDLGTIGHDAEPKVLVTIRGAARAEPAPWRLRIASYRRELPAVKHTGLFAAMHYRRQAQREGFDDVLFVNPDGTITEIATSNIGFIRAGHVVWPRAEWLAGITMTLINQSFGESTSTEPLTLADLPSMDAAFATNAATGIRALASVEGVSWPTEHRVLRQLRAAYEAQPAEAV
ncbi:branched-subunit amino acid aminotransferase/4-amino-4-deoxychorismate lyase [Tamaricihabitans halophyticus]|uniref:Branched-subunit amino acid aminotransferase/4-amino-4-deoxychorismate lyase n=1 Tax=Tamaricihabitans halophyticus TaxID=1262583 RepID=A0A4R2R601_9PSEU|nr:aminotransferase class IV family protein [Tamaricihabitans halophyticus]TCP57464.1 branched-subunit amino acid aminotransferase/4-amino-4-deoxychorismate lyase [Tamaricihabitans halophyticus]